MKLFNKEASNYLHLAQTFKQAAITLLKNLQAGALSKGNPRQLLLCTSNLALNKMPRREIIPKERRQQNIGLPSNLTRRKRLFLAARTSRGCHSGGRRETEK